MRCCCTCPRGTPTIDTPCFWAQDLELIRDEALEDPPRDPVLGAPLPGVVREWTALKAAGRAVEEAQRHMVRGPRAPSDGELGWGALGTHMADTCFWLLGCV